MKGLLKNNYFAVRSNAKAFSVFMLLLGIFVVAVISPSLLMGYALLGMIGFSLNAIAGLRKESSTKWSKYKLTAPVKRSDIVKSYFISQILWLIVGIAYAGIGVALSIMLHGVTLDRNVDIFMLFVVGIGISLFMGAIFPAVLFGRRGTKRSFSDNQLTLRYWNCYGAFYSHKYVISQDDCTAAYMRRNCYTCLFVIGICFILSFDR
jgi:hypothetical protein